jgi:hypothetical protein
MSTSDLLRESHKKALDARQKMLDVRPKDAIPPLPDRILPDHTGCLHYFETAAHLYLMAAGAYSAGDLITGHTYELSAYQYLMLGQTCAEQTA